MENINEYLVTKNDSFYLNWNCRYFLCENLILSIEKGEKIIVKTFDLNTKLSTRGKELKYVDHIKNVDFALDWLTEVFAIDFKNKEYTKIKLPYMITWIDANMIKTYTKNNIIYIFHSFAEYYETGIFIIDPINNTINNADFQRNDTDNYTHDNNDDSSYEYNPLHINRFKNLHSKTIYDGIIHDGNLLLNIDEDNMIYKYNIENDDINLLFAPSESLREIKVYKNLLIGTVLSKNNLIQIYDLGTSNLIKEYELCGKNETIVFWDIFDDKIISISEVYVSPYGQIYKENHDDDCNTKNMKIKQININTIIG